MHAILQLISALKKSEVNPKRHRLAENHHKSLETESLICSKSKYFPLNMFQFSGNPIELL